MSKRPRRSTLSDVARRANVSSTTVSRFLNQSGPVSEDIRQRIEAAMSALNYQPKRNSSKTVPEGSIAILLGDFLNPFFTEVVRGIQDETEHYSMVVTLYGLTDHPQRQHQLLQRLSKQRLDGVVLMGTPPFPELVAWQTRQQVPLIILNRRICQPGTYCIMVDFENAIYRATQHLINLGHTRVGYLGLNQWDIGLARQRGFEKALTEAGLALHPEWYISMPPGREIDGGFQAMQTLLSLPQGERPTAVIAFNDVMALGALHAVRVQGLSVPKDISIIGVDDIFASAHAHPPLTTINQPKYRMGVLAIQILYQLKQGQADLSSNYTLMESPLIVRESTGPAPQTS